MYYFKVPTMIDITCKFYTNIRLSSRISFLITYRYYMMHVILQLVQFGLIVIALFLGITVHKCISCTRVYKHASNLLRHRKYECGKVAMFLCPESGCDYKCKRRDNLLKHIRTHIRIQKF